MVPTSVSKLHNHRKTISQELLPAVSCWLSLEKLIWMLLMRDLKIVTAKTERT